jgi:tetratricopeptide (TPR) repeat protein
MTWRFLVLIALVSAISLGKEASVRAETFKRSESLEENIPKLAQAMPAPDYNIRAFVKYNLGDIQGAITDLNEAIRLNPADTLAYNNRGMMKSELGDKQGAIADFNEAIRLNPDFAGTYYNRGFMKYKLGDKQGAIADFNEAIRLKPDFDFAYFARGNAKKDLADKQGALADFRKASELFQQQGNTEGYNKSHEEIKKLGG